MNCYHAGKDQPRRVRSRHAEPCDLEAHDLAEHCRGCLPCPEPHCIVGWRGDRGNCETHAESACPSCAGKVREHLTEIVRLAGLPLVQAALDEGVDSEAADLLGPTADPSAWRQRGRHGHTYEPDSRIGELHPLWVLGRFDLIVTEHLGHTRTQRITVTSAADYLARNLHFLAADIEFDFADMAGDLADCRGHLERVLHDGEQVETGAPCMTCRVPLRLVRDTGTDSWHCPRCREQSTDAQYRYAVMHLHREAAEWLTDREMQLRTGVKAGTVRKWAERGEVKRRRDSGRTVYRVEDVVETAETRRMMGT